MFETLDKLMLAGLGALTMTRERAEKIFDEYVDRGRAAKAEKSGFVADLVDAADKSRHELEKLVNEQVRQAVGKLELASKEDLQRLAAKLDQVLGQKR